MKRKSAQILSLLLSVCVLGTSPVYADDFSPEPEVIEDSSADSSENDDMIANDESEVSIDADENSYAEADVTLEESEEQEAEAADIGDDEENSEELFSAGDNAVEFGEEEEEGLVAGILDESQEAVGASRVVEADIPASDSVKTTCSFYTGSNLEAQNYDVWSSTVDSYLTESPDGSLMRVEAGVLDSGELLIEYYDKQYNLQKTMTLQLGLPVFGAFYETGDYYYILTGANNPNEDDTKEVYRLSRYTKDWKAKDYCSLFGANTKVPFDAGSARMTKYGNYMFVRTCHKMYGGHQANVTFSVDLTNMSVVDRFTGVWESNVGYVSHSFNQFIQVDNGTLLGSDHGDTFPRTIAVLKYPADISKGKFVPDLFDAGCKLYRMIDITAIGDNYTGVSQGGFEYSDSSYLVAGNEDTDKYGRTRNVFVSSMPKEGGTETIHYFSDYAGTEDSAMTPHLIKTGNNSFILLWSSNGYVYYTAIDGTGNQVGSTHKMAGNLSDCVPSAINGKLIWYAWRNENTTFYEINLSDLSVNNAVRIANGHHREVGKTVTDGHVDDTCKICGDTIQYAVPTSFEFDTYSLNRHYVAVGDKFHMVSGQTYEITWNFDFQNKDLNRMWNIELTSSDPSVLEVNQEYARKADLKPLKSGRVTLTVQDKYNPAAMCKTEVYVDTIDEDVVSFGSRYFDYDGTEHDVLVNAYTSLYGLTEGEDYEVTYEGDRTNVGTASVTVSALGKFVGSVTAEIVIEPANIYRYGFKKEISSENCRYNGLPQKPDVTVQYGDRLLIENKDYKVECSDNIDSGSGKVTITGIGNYTGSSFYYFDISRGSLSDCTLSLSGTTFEYDGTVKVPKVTLKNGDIFLKEGVDYNVYYYNNFYPGTAEVYILGCGNYDGSLSTNFTINKKTMPVTTPKPAPITTPKPTAKPSSTTKVTPKPTAKPTPKPKAKPKPKAVKAPANTSRLSVRSKTKGKATVSWKAVKGITSYQVQYSNYKNMKKAKTVTVKSRSKSTTLKKLKRKKKCYVRIRTVKKVGKKNYYSKWSKVKSVKVK